MPVNREEVLRETRMFVIQECTVGERLEGMTSEQILGTMTPEQFLESLTGKQIAGWMMLQERFRGTAREPKLSFFSPNVRELLRRLLDTFA